MRQRAFNNRGQAYSEPARLGSGAQALLVLACVLAALAPIVCTFLCDRSPRVQVAAQPAGATQLAAVAAHSSLPGLPSAPPTTHCLAHHSCCQFGPLLAVVGLAPLLVVLRLRLSYAPLGSQPGASPITPPPQLALRPLGA